jgi:hypothetical protein
MFRLGLDQTSSSLYQKVACSRHDIHSYQTTRNSSTNILSLWTLIHWNHLPNSVVHANSLEAFKTALRNQRQ